MDAPTTTPSAGSGSDGSDGGGGWFTPRTAPAPQPPTTGSGQEATPEEHRIPEPRQAPTAQQTQQPAPPRAAETPGPVAASARTAPTHASPDAILVRRTMEEIGPVADRVTSYFYALLFVRHPELRPLFPAAMDTQRDRLLKALLTAAEHIDNKDVLVAYLKNLGRGHRKYGTQADHYPAVGECLIAALTQYATTTWNAETEAAWVRTYTTISQVMIDAAAADELKAAGLVAGRGRLARSAHPRRRRGDRAARSALPVPGRAVHDAGDALVAADLAALLVRVRAPIRRAALVPREGGPGGLGLQRPGAPGPPRRRAAPRPAHAAP